MAVANYTAGQDSIIYLDDTDTVPFATGRVDLTLVPAPGALSLAGVGVLMMAQRRRG